MPPDYRLSYETYVQQIIEKAICRDIVLTRKQTERANGDAFYIKFYRLCFPIAHTFKREVI